MKITPHLIHIFFIANSVLYLPSIILTYSKSDKIPVSVIIPNLDGTEKTITLMINSTWNITQYNDFKEKYDIEIHAPPNKILMTFHIIYPNQPYSKKLNNLLKLTKLARDEIITGALEKKLKIYKITLSTNSKITMGYYFIATSNYQSNSKFNANLDDWPILTTILYNLDDAFVHISIFSTSKQQSLFKEIIDIFPPARSQ